MSEIYKKEVSQLIKKSRMHCSCRAEDMAKKNAYACLLMYSYIYFIDDGLFPSIFLIWL